MFLKFFLILVVQIHGLSANPSVTQSPGAKCVGLGETVSFTCTASTGVDDDLSWYQQKPGQPPTLLFYQISTNESAPSHFSSSGSEPEFTLTIRGVEAADAGDYYCLGVHEVGVVQPTLTVLPPSKEQQQSSVTLVCLAQGGFPSTWRLGWKVGGSSRSSGVSNSLEVLGRDGLYSWSSTLSLPAEQWREAGSVSCEANQDGRSPVTQSLDPDSCSH
ncbi:immunoglobulin kappa light chain-like [Nematolebias whitei]|uniref:immunoglobulin kappa light chain-like n=1 Tax=Nematolebias whitei TaxID=451745 RepID=UPI0018972F06|nr:immunoglobulin kappa light chain-like [Nematolebias whitei]